jgi:CheY-like chemotaxis protein
MSQTVPEILVVENNPGDVRLLLEAFKESGFEAKLHVVRDGQEAMQYLRHEQLFEKCPRPQLILLDLNMPRKDGREVLAEIKNEPSLRQIPVMILSTSRRPEDVRSAYDLHANCYAPKPFDINGLIGLVKTIRDFWFRTTLLSEGSDPRSAVSAA